MKAELRDGTQYCSKGSGALQLHKILYSHMNNPMGGRTKSVQNYISATYPDGHAETLFTPLSPFETPEALDKICEEYNRVIGKYISLEAKIARNKDLYYNALSQAQLQELSLLDLPSDGKTEQVRPQYLYIDFVGELF